MHHLKEWERLRADSVSLTGRIENRHLKRKKPILNITNDEIIANFSDSDEEEGTEIKPIQQSTLRPQHSPEMPPQCKKGKSGMRKTKAIEWRGDWWRSFDMAGEEKELNESVGNCVDAFASLEKGVEGGVGKRRMTEGDGFVMEAGGWVDEIDLFQSSDEETGVLAPSTAHGSHWLDHVKKEPSSPDKQTAHFSPVDSAKKKRVKFVKNGLAEQLQKVCSRERADIAFWRLKKPNEKDRDGCVELRVLHHYMQASLLVAHCSVLSDGQYREIGFVDVIFSSDIRSHLQLMKGSVVTIHPPWQEMVIQSSPFPLLLCTYYCHSSIQDQAREVSPRKKVLLSPLKMDPIDGTQRHMTLMPRKSVKRVIHFNDDNNKDSTALKDPQSVLPSERSLTTIQASTHCTSGQQHSSIVEAIESQGGVLTTHLCVVGRVQRVYRKRVASRGRLPPSSSCTSSLRMQIDQQQTWEICQCVLAQDSSGMFFEIVISNSTSGDQTSWMDCVNSSEGRVCRFFGLRIVRRTNALRSLDLFSLIRSIMLQSRSVTQLLDQQLGGENDDTGKTPIQSYCYVLSNTAGRVSQAERCDEENEGSCFPAFVSSPILESFHLDSEMVNYRYSLVGCVSYYYVPNSNSFHSLQDRHLFITSCETTSTVSQLVHVCVTTDCALTDIQSHWISNSSLVCLRDLIVTKQESELSLVADGFTVIQRAHSACEEISPTSLLCVMEDEQCRILRSLLPPALPLLSLDTMANSLVCITGCISEQTAYCWPICNTCGNKNLEDNNPSKQAGELYCHHCEIHVISPDIGTELTVSVEGENIPTSSTVTVQLLQSTVESLLPDMSTQNAEEGYDIHSVLGKPLPTMTCFIISTTIQSNGCKHFISKQISLNN